MPSECPRLPGKNYMLELVDDLSEAEKRFLEDDDHSYLPTKDLSTLLDPLLIDYMAAVKSGSSTGQHTIEISYSFSFPCVCVLLPRQLGIPIRS